jgi:DNA-binding NarL/FixJ family response regulator
MIEDEGMLAELFGEYVQMVPDSEFLGVCSDGRLALGRCIETQPDVVILDIRLPGVTGLEMLTQIRREVPQARVLVFSGSLDAYSVRVAMEGDAAGFVEKSYGMAELLKAIGEVTAGRRYYSAGAQDYVNKLKAGA